MTTRTLLVSWIGNTDLAAMASDMGQDGEELLAEAKVTARNVDKPGPIKTAVQSRAFDEIHLLSNYANIVHKPFSKWLGRKCVIHPVELSDPTDYDGIFRGADRVLSELAGQSITDSRKLSILLSPGTPAMAVVWVLLGSSRYPADFYQTHKGAIHAAKIPKDLFEGIVPDLIRDRDLAFQALAAKSPQEVEGFERIGGESLAIRIAVGQAQRAALRDVPVLLLGESGTGKEMFASAIHKASRRRSAPYRSINCAAIPSELLESELFGHVKGGFTGAVKDKPGLFAQADGGTLFLDEIGECAPLLQAKLLRVLQPPDDCGPCHRVFRAVGADKDTTSNVRIIAATNRNLQKEIGANRFREDLFYRLAVIALELPPLRDRKKDIPLLTDRFLAQVNRDFGEQDRTYKHKSISPTAMEFVKRHHWPGNVRQLFNAIVRASVMADSEVIERRDITAATGHVIDEPILNMLEPLGNGFRLEEHLNSIRSHYLQRAMEEARGVKTRARELLGLNSYQTLDAQLKRLKVKWSRQPDA